MPNRTPSPARHKRLSVLVNAEEDAALDRAAADQGVSRSDVLRSALRNYVSPKRGDTAPRASRGER